MPIYVSMEFTLLIIPRLLALLDGLLIRETTVFSPVPVLNTLYEACKVITNYFFPIPNHHIRNENSFCISVWVSIETMFCTYYLISACLMVC